MWIFRAVRHILACGTAAAVIGAAGAAAGQTTCHVAWTKVEMGGWTLNPTYVESGGLVTVNGFVALADPAGLKGDNLTAVWYVRQNGDWVVKSWTTQDPWEAIEAVKQELSIPGDDDKAWSVSSLPGSTPTAGTAKDYDRGVMWDDPAAPLLDAAPDRDAMLASLTDAGYASATVPVEAEDECKTSEKLEAIAVMAEGLIAAGDEAVLTIPATAATCQVLVSGPIGPAPTRPAKPATPPAWSPPGTVPTAPGWTPGTWPAAPAWACRTVLIGGGGTNCICSRNRRWGRWETRGCWIFFTCTRWHEIIENEVCTDINVACPAGGPPSGASNCTTTYY